MINLLLLLLLLACLGITAAWVAENPGSVVIHWFDYRIDTSFAFLLLLAVAAALALAYITLLVRRLILFPQRYIEQKSLKQFKKGLTELTYSVAALAAADVKTAERHTKKAGKLLGDSPIVLLLGAQIARSKGDDETTRALLTQMLSHKETEYLAARSLSDVAGKQQQLPQALELAERAHSLNPGDIIPVLSLQMKLSKWQEAQMTINTAVRKGRLSRGEWRRYKGLVYVQHGLELMAEGQHEAALAAARYGLKQLPDFAPAIALAAQAYDATGQSKKAVKLLAAAIKKLPHPQLVEALRRLVAGEPAARQAKVLGKTPVASDSGESWACSACGQAAKEWAAHCPSCSAFDTLDWKKRELKFVA